MRLFSDQFHFKYGGLLESSTANKRDGDPTSAIIAPLKTRSHWTAEQYEAFFAETVAWPRECAPCMEICGVICDNLPAQVVGLLQLLRNTTNSAIIHMPCLSQIVNLVFTQTIKSDLCYEVFVTRPEIIRTPHSAQSIHIIGLRCPKLIRTRRVYLEDVLAFLIDQINDVQTVLALADVAPVTAAHRRTHFG
jgi:hypothetical protein